MTTAKLDSAHKIVLDEQQGLITQIERIVPNLKKKGRANFTPEMLISRRDYLHQLWDKIGKRNAELINMVPLDVQKSVDYFANDRFDEVSEQVLDHLDFFAQELAKLQPYASQSFQGEPPGPSTAAPVSRFDSVQFPKQKLPVFRGDIHEWKTFADLFKAAVIKNQNLSNATRMQYLFLSLEGRAKASIADFDIADDNFELAWQALQDEYENELVLTSGLLDRILDLAVIRHDKLESLQQFAEKILQTLATLKKMGYPVDTWDALLVRIVTRKFDDELEKEWRRDFCGDKKFPKFADVKSFIQKTTNAMLSKSKRKTVDSATKKFEKPRDKSHAHLAEDVRDGTKSTGSCQLCKQPSPSARIGNFTLG